MRSSESRNVVPQFPFPPKELYQRFEDSSYVQDPPKPPDRDTEYCIFGVPRKIDRELLPSLESQGHRILFKATEKKTQAIKRLILHSLKRYLNILDILSSRNPSWSTIEEELQSIEEQFVNIYHLLNLLRLDQAKWRLYKLFSLQVSKKETLAEKLKSERQEVLSLLQSDTQNLLSSFEWKSSLDSYLSDDVKEETFEEEPQPSPKEGVWDIREVIKSVLSRENEDEMERRE
ncbi:hypothetical protein GAYE_SCF18G3894 [Galdieria yellowstonensis]|uniref:Mediator of RNA polymerase II transcription subunit 7 n=1 Tax=Galdieria yellowstonensis TaxID=3028027 RepID=A0AAV9IEU6_9RHOD|nr:hypothetical protein GAYE_SCF18G3894 [Galdieria yellowstonensis]